MGEFLEKIPEDIKGHLREITKTSGLPPGDESVEKIAKVWLEKKQVFEDKIGEMGMEEVDYISVDDERAALAITYSGSLVNIGPIINGVRNAGYISIGLRRDVPDAAVKEGSKLAKDVEVDRQIEFETGPVKNTSPIFKIAVLTEELPAIEQEEKINQATLVIQEEFVEVNKTMISEQ
jgi:hypothetical protein